MRYWVVARRNWGGITLCNCSQVTIALYHKSEALTKSKLRSTSVPKSFVSVRIAQIFLRRVIVNIYDINYNHLFFLHICHKNLIEIPCYINVFNINEIFIRRRNKTELNNECDNTCNNLSELERNISLKLIFVSNVKWII